MPYAGPTTLKQWTEYGRRKLRRNDDLVTVTFGKTGRGKSGFTLLLGRKMQDHPLDTVDDLTRRFLFTSDGLLESARSLPEFSFISLDEAMVGGGNRRRAMSTSNVDVQEHLNTCREFHHHLNFTAPLFADLDIAIQTRAAWAFECVERGRGIAYENIVAGGPKARSTYLQPRFEFRWPDPAVATPDLWQAYRAHKRRYSFHGADPKKVQYRAEVERLREIVRQEATEWLRP